MREGEVVCHKGEVGNEFFLIFHGAVRNSIEIFYRILCMEVDIFPVPGEEPVATYVAGETFGELALLHDAPRAATVVCKNDCIFGILQREPFTRATAPLK